MSKKTPYEMVKEFHEAFRHDAPKEVTAIPAEKVIQRTVWKVEEAVELLHATAGGNVEEFYKLMQALNQGIGDAIRKQLDEGEYEDKDEFEILVRQIDALTDLSYFTYGTFVSMGVDPGPFFEIVQEANMGKLDPETGQPIIRESDGKILKPKNWEKDFAPEPKIREELKRQMEAKKND